MQAKKTVTFNLITLFCRHLACELFRAEAHQLELPGQTIIYKTSLPLMEIGNTMHRSIRKLNKQNKQKSEFPESHPAHNTLDCFAKRKEKHKKSSPEQMGICTKQ